MIQQSVNSDLMSTRISHSSSFSIFVQQPKVLNDGLLSFSGYTVSFLGGPPDEEMSQIAMKDVFSLIG